MIGCKEYGAVNKAWTLHGLLAHTSATSSPNWVAGALPAPLYMIGTLLPERARSSEWSTDPSRTVGTYLCNLLPELGRIFRQLYFAVPVMASMSVKKYCIGG
ncbi:hypothetical protein B0H13DRAFT_1864940 [Mycena leptocephala]|nr:hypothetical protein B0H13DRAFT_1864940 [Mycena leptocephala]